MTLIADQLVAIAAAAEDTRKAIYDRGAILPPGSGLAAFAPALRQAKPVPDPPPDWPDLDVGFTPGTMRGLVMIQADDAENWVSLSATAGGSYTVDWGDGTSETIADAATATHQYAWATAGPVCSEGYKTAIVTVSAATPITTLDLVKLPAAWVDADRNWSIWLDLLIDLPACTSLLIGQDRTVVKHQRLRQAHIRRWGVTNASNMFAFCTSLTRVPDVLNLTACTNASNMFYFCTSLTRVPDVLNLTACTNASNMFAFCMSLTRVPELGVRYSISFQRTGLRRLALNDLFAGLGTAAGAQTVTISETPGRLTCDKTIATAKGWTVAT